MNSPGIESFEFQPGRIVAGKYVVLDRLGAGWEGEVYLVREQHTQIKRAAKFFFPQRNLRRRISTAQARKLHKLRECEILIPYHVHEEIEFNGNTVVCLISDYVEGRVLTHFLEEQPGGRLPVFQALHLLHSLAAGVEEIHLRGEYHGDLHQDNVMIKRSGLGFRLKLFDFYQWGRSTKAELRDDVFDLIKLFHDIVDGTQLAPEQRRIIKGICCGLRRAAVLRRFPTVTKLRGYLEVLEWE